MGLTNYPFKSVDEITDVEAKGLVKELREKGKSEEEILKTILAGTREHTRLLLPWNELANSYPNHLQQTPDEIITAAYKQLIKLRNKDKTLIYGDFHVISRKKNRFVYSRKGDSEYIIDCNLCNRSVSAWKLDQNYEMICSTGTFTGQDKFLQNEDMLSPYEVRIWKRK